MHDLVHDLALLVGKPESFSIDSNNIQCNNPTKVHHLSFTDCSCLEGNEVPSWLLEMKHLRTIYFPYVDEVPTKKSFLETCISRFHYLRMLDLHGQSFEVLPSSISKLKYLRHLDLSKNVKLKSLPNSICKLVALEMLYLAHCEGLERLPKSIGKLIRLRHLSITTKEKCLPEKEIRCLTSLQRIWIIKCPNMKFLLSNEGMRSLSALRILWISDCKSLVSLPASGLKSLTMLNDIFILGCEMLDLNVDDRLCVGEAQRETVAEEANQVEGRGFVSLRILYLWEMPKLVALPSWILCGANTTLQRLQISRCENLTELMSGRLLENLKALQILWIYNCPQLISLPDSIRTPASLQEIHIKGCPKLSERCLREIGEDWEKIAQVPNIYLDGVKI
ncbi:hypothetical protein NMG60_11032008 [Bertholletia excelsa]